MANSNCSRQQKATDADGVRTFHLVDADNLLGDPTTTDRAFIEATFAAYRLAAGYRSGDLVVVATGCNGLHVFEVEAAWPGALHRRRSGSDGADLELLEEAKWAAESGRFGRVVIGSGDRIFIVAFDALRASDLTVDVVARPRSLARCLAIRARNHVTPLAAIDPPQIVEQVPLVRLADYVPSRGGKRQPMRRMMGSDDRSMELMASA